MFGDVAVILRGALVLLYFSGGVGLLADSPQDTTGGSGSIKDAVE